MPGYYVHLAASNPSARKNRSFICGLEIPDILKKYLKSYGLEGAKQKYNIIKTKDMPDFSYFELRIKQDESKGKRNGLHYGPSSCPDIKFFWNNLSESQKKNPFYIGYLWHLLTDLLIYKYLDIETKFNETFKKYPQDKNFIKIQKQEIKKLHDDWDKTNAIIRDEYPDVKLTKEIIELGIVKFIKNNKLNYINYDTVKYLIDYLRQYNPLNENIDNIITNIINMLPNSNKELENNNK